MEAEDRIIYKLSPQATYCPLGNYREDAVTSLRAGPLQHLLRWWEPDDRMEKQVLGGLQT